MELTRLWREGIWKREGTQKWGVMKKADTKLLWLVTVFGQTLGKRRGFCLGVWGQQHLRDQSAGLERTRTTILNSSFVRAGLLFQCYVRSVFLSECGCWIYSWMASPGAELTFQKVRLWIWAEICCHQLVHAVGLEHWSFGTTDDKLFES